MTNFTDDEIAGRGPLIIEMLQAEMQFSVLVAVEEIVRQDEAGAMVAFLTKINSGAASATSITPPRRSATLVKSNTPHRWHVGPGEPEEVPRLMPSAGTSPIVARLLDKHGASSYSGLSVATLERRVRERRIAVYRVGGKVLFDPADLDVYVRAARVEASRP